MPVIAPSGNSEGSIYRGKDGNAYQVINGQDVRVSNSKLTIAGFKPLPNTITVDGVTFNRDKNGNITLSENGRLIATTEAEIQKVNVERFGGQLQERLEKEVSSQQQQQNYLLIGGGLLLFVLLIRG
jgi:ribosomal protein L24